MCVVTIATASAVAMRIQNSAGVLSVARNTLRTEYQVGAAKYGNSFVAKNQFRDAGDTSAVTEMVERHEGAESARLCERLLNRQPDGFRVVRGADRR